MLENIKKIYINYKEIINYMFFGALATIVSLGSKYLLLFSFLNAENGIHLQISVVVSWIAAVLFAYFTNRKYVFQSTNTNKFKEFISFVTARIATLLLEMIILWFFITYLKLNSDFQVIIFTGIAQIVVIVGNYVFSKLFVFKKT